MNSQTFSLLIAFLLAIAQVQTNETRIIGEVTHDSILAPYMNKDVKTLYKVWHFLNNKDYNYNTLQGINRYVTFKENLKFIDTHNASTSSYKMGLNHLSDMTDQEVKEFYNLRTMSIRELSKNLRSLKSISLDDFQDDDEPDVQRVSADRPLINHSAAMQPVRNQGGCGSCWAFATQAVLEGNYVLWKAPLNDYFSTQQLVDCDANNKGCDGGWYGAAMRYFTLNTLVFESGYKYTAKAATCAYTAGMTGDTKITITGYAYYQAGKSIDVYNALLKLGPVGVAVDCNADFSKYKSGIFDSPCAQTINHAVTLIGYSDTPVNHFIIRNSWGPKWGEAGHIRIKDNGTDASSCNVEKYAYQPLAFKQ